MQRQLIDNLLKWKNRPNRKPLVLRGARQTGKTWLLKEFGRTAFDDTVYINFENENRLRTLFAQDYNPRRIVGALEMHIGHRIDASRTLIIFDEIQAVEGGLTALKYFAEDAPQYAVATAGSLLGMALHSGASFPVGKVDFLDLYPMTFAEYLRACGRELLWEAVARQDWPSVAPFHDELLTLLRQYLYVGGMPEVVGLWTSTADWQAVRDKQQDILRAYEADFSKHVPPAQVPRLGMVWNSLPAQLAKENKKFVYGIIREGARAKDYELAIAWLHNCGLVLRSHRVSAPRLPLKAYEEPQTFKLFLSDVGLLGAMSGTTPRMMADGDALFTEFKGALAEQYVMQELMAAGLDYVGYWTNDRSTAEVDFVVQHDGRLVPIEVKAGQNLRSRSFSLFVEKHTPPLAIKASTLPFHPGQPIVNVPLYGFLPLLLQGQAPSV